MLSHMIDLGQQSAYAKEMRKFEGHFSKFGPPGRPYEFRDYPSALYRPTRAKDTGVVSFELATATDDRHRERLERDGFVHGGKCAALAHLEAQEFEMAELAAGRVPGDMRMTTKAKDEAEAVDSATIAHLPVIPEVRDRTEHMLNADKGRRR